MGIGVRINHGNGWVGFSGFNKGVRCPIFTFSEFSSVIGFYVVVQLRVVSYARRRRLPWLMVSLADGFPG